MRRRRIHPFWIFLVATAVALLQTAALRAQTGRTGRSSAFTAVRWDEYTFKFLSGNQMAQVLDANGHVIGTILAQNGTLLVLPTVTGDAADKLKQSFQAWKDQGGEKELNGAGASNPGAQASAAEAQPPQSAKSSPGPARASQATKERAAMPPAGAGGSADGAMVVGGAALGTLNNPETAEMIRNNLTLLLDLQRLRLEPALLDDPQVMKFFVLMNNCFYLKGDGTSSQRNNQFFRLMRNELDYPKAAEYYRSKAAEILASLPHSARATVGSAQLGDYDTAKHVFPFKPILVPGRPPRQVKVVLEQQEPMQAVDQIDAAIAESAACGQAMSVRILGERTGKFAKVYVFNTDKPITFTEVPMEMAAARGYIETAPGIRPVRFDAELEMLESPAPKVIENCDNRQNQTCVEFAARVKKVTAVDPGITGMYGKTKPEKVLAVVYP